jgi:hypothetical protein
MTREASRELDAEIAEKVMGADMPRFFPGAYPLQRRVDAPYSTEIESAWLVVESMRAKGWSLSLDDLGYDGEEWRVRFEHSERREHDIKESWVYADAVTAPLAICLASLKALEG